MVPFLCVTCGTQYAPSDEPPARCLICDEPRQYVGWEGQRWTTMEELRRDHRAKLAEEDPGLLGIGVEPKFGIGQRALLVPGEGGNVLWDCVALLDDEIMAAVEARGGLAAIAISHPHYYTSMVEWSRAFGGAPIHLHAADARWVMRSDPAIESWEGDELELGPGLTLLRLGGHFPGATVLHWRDGADGRGALLSGDVVQVVPDRRWVSFMWSYPNLVPLPAAEVRRIARALEPWRFDRIHGAWWSTRVGEDGSGAVRRSAERYVRALEEPPG